MIGLLAAASRYVSMSHSTEAEKKHFRATRPHQWWDEPNRTG